MKFNTHQGLSIGRKRGLASLHPRGTYQHLEILLVIEIGKFYWHLAQDGKNIAKHPKAQRTVSATKNNRSLGPTLLRLRSLSRGDSSFLAPSISPDR